MYQMFHCCRKLAQRNIKSDYMQFVIILYTENLSRLIKEYIAKESKNNTISSEMLRVDIIF